MNEGKVKWFNDARGFGMIEAIGFDSLLFVHYNYIVGQGFKTLKEGQAVTFDVYESKQGLEAKNVSAK